MQAVRKHLCVGSLRRVSRGHRRSASRIVSSLLLTVTLLSPVNPVSTGIVTALALTGLSALPTQAAGARMVPKGNRSQTQPAIPFASSRRTSAFNSTYENKFEKVVNVLQRDRGLIRSIKRVAALYDIDPIHMIGAIVGEHTYNYSTLDSAQTYYIKALSYAGLNIEFALNGEHVMDFVEKPQFERCRAGSPDSDKLWTCYEDVWEANFRRRSVNGTRYPNKSFNESFFQPLFAGQSFGLGQLSPLTVLKMSDRVHRVSGMRKLDARDASGVYSATMDPNKSLHYMAAIIQDSIEAYKSVAMVDISANPGLTATLYNLGDPWIRARKFRNSGSAWPRENYYGWLVNDRLEDLKSIL